MTDNTSLQIRISPELKARLQAVAEYEMADMSTIVRRATLREIREIERLLNIPSTDREAQDQ